MTYRQCTEPGCNRAARANGLCNTHYQKSRRPVQLCKAVGCEEKAFRNGFCKPHYSEHHAANKTIEVCSQEGCGRPVHSKELCQPHYRQAQRRQRGLQKPGPKPKPSMPYSRHSESNFSHHATSETPKHYCGRPFDSDALYPNGRRRCLHCDPLVVSVNCIHGHPRSEYAYERPVTPYTPGCRKCDAIAQVAMRYLSKYGLSQEDIATRLEAQDYRCTICKKPFEPDNGRRPEVDHDHSHCNAQITCGKCVRDIICQAVQQNDRRRW